jgi:hypothetical protein
MENHAMVSIAMTKTIESPQATRAPRTGRRLRANLYNIITTNSLEVAVKKEKCPEGRRNSLKTLDSAKKTQGFPLIVFGRAWLDLARFGKISSWLGKTRLALAAAAVALRPPWPLRLAVAAAVVGWRRAP